MICQSDNVAITITLGHELMEVSLSRYGNGAHYEEHCRCGAAMELTVAAGGDDAVQSIDLLCSRCENDRKLNFAAANSMPNHPVANAVCERVVERHNGLEMRIVADQHLSKC